jgi:hypothetical protein
MRHIAAIIFLSAVLFATSCANTEERSANSPILCDAARVREIVKAEYDPVVIESIEFRNVLGVHENVWEVHARVSHPKHDTLDGPGQKAIIIIDSATGKIIELNKARSK